MTIQFSPVDFSILSSSIQGSDEGQNFRLDRDFLKECRTAITGWQNATEQLRHMDQQIEKIELQAKSPKEISKSRRFGLLYLAGAVAIAALTVFASLWLHSQYLSVLALGMATGSPVALVMLLAIGVAGVAAVGFGGVGTIGCLGLGGARLIAPAWSIRSRKPSSEERRRLEQEQKRHLLHQHDSQSLVRTVRRYLDSLDSFAAQVPADKIKMHRELHSLEQGLQVITRNS